MAKQLTLVVAMDAQRGIGVDNKLPWHLPEDLAHFKRVTLGKPIIMGRKTIDSIGRPLPKRRNIVVTRNESWAAEGAERAASLDDALAAAARSEPDWIWVIGGGELFRESIARADRLEVTELDLEVAGDTTAPGRDGWRAVGVDPAAGWHTSRSGIRYRYVTLEPPA